MSVIRLKHNGFGGNVDYVMCINASGNMRPFIQEFKSNAHKIPDIFLEMLDCAGRGPVPFRVKIILFRSGGCGAPEIEESPFFVLVGDFEGENQMVDFLEYVNSIQPMGEDLGENALEALYCAIKSDWWESGSIKRHAITLLTDVVPPAMRDWAASPDFPEGAPSILPMIIDAWNNEMQLRTKRLCVFMPQSAAAELFFDTDNTIYAFAAEKCGLDDLDIDSLIKIFCNQALP